jgi:hypothetical protein
MRFLGARGNKSSQLKKTANILKHFKLYMTQTRLFSFDYPNLNIPDEPILTLPCLSYSSLSYLI